MRNFADKATVYSWDARQVGTKRTVAYYVDTQAKDIFITVLVEIS